MRKIYGIVLALPLLLGAASPGQSGLSMGQARADAHATVSNLALVVWGAQVPMVPVDVSANKPYEQWIAQRPEDRGSDPPQGVLVSVTYRGGIVEGIGITYASERTPLKAAADASALEALARYVRQIAPPYATDLSAAAQLATSACGDPPFRLRYTVLRGSRADYWYNAPANESGPGQFTLTIHPLNDRKTPRYLVEIKTCDFAEPGD